ncbi:MAG: DUF2203 domain-containing protein [Dehalococcoidia bacterium]
MKLFTLEEAEALLPQARDEVLAMQSCKREIDVLREALVDAAGRATGNGHVKDEEALAEKRRKAEALVQQLNERLARLNEWGVELKGLDEGLLDFPSEREGRVVYLCWRLGEEHITTWHEIDAGFGGRQAL